MLIATWSRVLRATSELLFFTLMEVTLLLSSP